MTESRFPHDPIEHSKAIEAITESKTTQFEENPELKNSAIYWYPKLREALSSVSTVADIQTLFVNIERLNVFEIVNRSDEQLSDAEIEQIDQCPGQWDVDEISRAVEAVGTPAFIRTDTDSAKKNILGGSKIESHTDNEIDQTTETLIRHISHNGGQLPRFNCLLVREWIDIDSRFTAYDGTPIGPEVRIFVRDGQIECHHFYWPNYEPAFTDQIDPETGSDWERDLEEMETITAEAVESTLRDATEHISQTFEGYWSIDFALSDDGSWYAIDMARGSDSWHPEFCEHNSSV